MSGANLRYANLSGADLRDTDFRGANLRGVNLYLADLRGANVNGTLFKDNQGISSALRQQLIVLGAIFD